MSTLIAIAYPDRKPPSGCAKSSSGRRRSTWSRSRTSVVVEHGPDGKIKLHQASGPAGAGAAGGALWGGLIGLLFLAPLLGMAVGAARGALGRKMSDIGVDDDFVREFGDKLPAGAAALIALGGSKARDKVIERVKGYGGEMVQSSLARGSGGAAARGARRIRPRADLELGTRDRPRADPGHVARTQPRARRRRRPASR